MSCKTIAGDGHFGRTLVSRCGVNQYVEGERHVGSLGLRREPALFVLLVFTGLRIREALGLYLGRR